MKRHVFTGILALSLVLSSALATDDEDVRALDVSMCGVFFFVEVTRAEDDDTATEPDEASTLSFLYDTGASFTVVDPDALEAATGTRLDEGKTVNLTNARSGDVQFTSFKARVRDLDHLSVALGREIEGILAHDAFNGWVATLDYQGQAMTITRGRLPRPDGRRTFSARGPDRRPWLRVDFAGLTRKVLIDSGSSGSFAVNDLERLELQSNPIKTGYSVRFRTIEARHAARLDGEATFGDLVVEEPMVSSVPGSELFGGQVLRHFRLAYDAKSRRIRFDPYEERSVPPAPPLTSGGFFWVPKDGELVVRELIPGFEQESGGVLPGDRAIAVDGRPMTERGCPRPDDPPKPYVLKVERDGEVLERSVTPAVLIP